jgi:putative tryptophan/tyrosine transport system substrate-binding protein
VPRDKDFRNVAFQMCNPSASPKPQTSWGRSRNNTAYASLPRLVEFATSKRIPTMYPFREAVEAGGLVAYTTLLPELFRRVASYVDKILKGAKPAEIPVEQPTKLELLINLKTAKALGLTIPPSLLLRADQVIE